MNCLYLKEEGELLAKWACPYVIRHIRHFKDRSTYYIYMEYADQGNLVNYVRKYIEKKVGDDDVWKESKILKIFIQLLLGLKRIHDNKIIHRDIKCPNILTFKDGQVKICDFGASARKETAMTSIGIGDYTALEIGGRNIYN